MQCHVVVTNGFFFLSDEAVTGKQALFEDNPTEILGKNRTKRRIDHGISDSIIPWKFLLEPGPQGTPGGVASFKKQF